MAVYPLRPKQRGPRCSYCSEKAVYRGFGFGKFSCATHLPELKQWDRIESDAFFQVEE